MSFSELGLSPEVLQAVAEAGYAAPTPIQAQAIPQILRGRDVLGCAQTGTGKTASFTLPMIDILAAGRSRARMPRSLILGPTRELATQVSASFETYGKYHKLNMALLIGGEGFAEQARKLDRGVDVLIATPGRLLDLIERGKILLSDVKVLVIDEADRMLDMGFIPDVERIVGFLPKIRQTLFFSATMPPEIRRLADAFLMNPKEISVAPPASPAALVEQFMIVVDPVEKREALRRLIRQEEVRNAIVFCNRKRDVDILHKSLRKHGFDALCLHGDMAQSHRTEALELFKSGTVHLMVASDVAARGLDVHGLSHVFNFDVPIHAEDYVHRIGRTGRAGREGRAFTIASPEDGRFVDSIEKLIGKAIPRIDIEGIESQNLVYEEGRGGRGRGRKAAPAAKAAPRAAAAPVKSPERSEIQVPEKPARETPVRDTSRRERPAPETPVREAPVREPQRRERRPRVAEAPPAKPVIAPVPIRAGAPSRSSPRPEYRNRDYGDDMSPVGFGDDLPAFLRRPVKTVETR